MKRRRIDQNIKVNFLNKIIELISNSNSTILGNSSSLDIRVDNLNTLIYNTLNDNLKAELLNRSNNINIFDILGFKVTVFTFDYNFNGDYWHNNVHFIT